MNEGVKAFTLSAAGAKVRKGSGIVARKHGSKLPNYVQSAASGEKTLQSQFLQKKSKPFESFFRNEKTIFDTKSSIFISRFSRKYSGQ